MHEHVTLLRPDVRDPEARGISWTLPPDLLGQSAALASVSSVPLVVGLMVATGTTSFRPDPGQFFFWLVSPYLIVVGMAYVGLPGGLRPGYRGTAGQGAGELPPGGKAGTGRPAVWRTGC
jgi:hypothetical protein